ncbi:MAG: effector-associated domain EAD1-containing protein, partial [Candidatus Hodarchaeota archaeon]
REPLHEQDEKYCFLASDTTYQIKDKELELDNIISSEDILKRLRPLEVKHQAILFNTCFAGRVKRKKYDAEGLALKAVRLSEFKELSHSKNWIVGAACKEEEYSYIDDINPAFEISYFGKYLLSGLNRQEPGLLDIITLFQHIKDEVTREIKSLNFTQTPFIIETKKLKLDHKQISCFPIAFLPQAKSPPLHETPALPDTSSKKQNQSPVGLEIGVTGEIEATTENITVEKSELTHIEAKEVYIGEGSYRLKKTRPLESSKEPLNQLQFTGSQQEQLWEAILRRFSKADLSQLLLFKLDKSFEQIAQGPAYRDQVRNLIITAMMEGWLCELIYAAYKARLHDQTLETFARMCGC